MKLLYITPIINDEGGLPKVLSVKKCYKFSDCQILILY